MSAWDSIKKAFTPSHKTYADRHAEIQAQQVAAGKAFQCAQCGTIYYNQRNGCPKCQAPQGGWPSEQKQLIRTYTGRHMDKDFQDDAALLAKAGGWRVQSQNYGGLGMAGQGTLVELALSTSRTRQAGARKAAQLSVVYERD